MSEKCKHCGGLKIDPYGDPYHCVECNGTGTREGELMVALKFALVLIDECAADTIGTSTEIEFVRAGERIRAAISTR